MTLHIYVCACIANGDGSSVKAWPIVMGFECLTNRVVDMCLNYVTF